ncbi:MAG: hypothetical protein AAFX93_05525 [Verrucomicrobiota bacterium]
MINYLRFLILSSLFAVSSPFVFGQLPVNAPWEYDAPNRPVVLIEADRYVYTLGEYATADRILRSTIAGRNYNSAVTEFLVWEDRISGDQWFYNYLIGFSKEPIDISGEPGQLQTRTVGRKAQFKLFSNSAASGNPFPTELPSDTGLYAWRYELRNEDGTKTIARSYALYSIVDEIVEVQGDINKDILWSADNAYHLNGRVNVAQNSVLTIEPGTVVMGGTDELSLLNIESGSRIVADGEVTKPIIFTSDKPLGERATSDWGGIIINGDAPVNEPNAEGEGGTGRYGGNNPNHDGGVLRYVRIEFSGRIFSEVDELNGLTLQGCGDGTILDHVQIHHPSDDGIEFFGGTVNARNLLMTGCGDDSLDWTYGYQGKLQNLVMIQLFSEADKGIEADNHTTNFDAQPRSKPTIYNATFLGLAISQPDKAKQSNAILMRRGSGGLVYNTIFAGFGGMSAGIESVASASLHADGGLVVENCVFYQNFLLARTLSEKLPNEELVSRIMTDTANNNVFANPGFTSINPEKPDLTPMPNSLAANPPTIAEPPADGFFKPVTYLGGIDPTDPNGPWVFAPWTTYSPN